jgi:hypothetical protein
MMRSELRILKRCVHATPYFHLQFTTQKQIDQATGKGSFLSSSAGKSLVTFSISLYSFQSPILPNPMSETKRDFFRNKWLFSAASSGDARKIRKLIGEKVDVNTQDEQGRTPLFCAIWNGNEEVARLLLEAGADLELKDKNNQTPLHLASYLGEVEVVELLLVLGADRAAKDKDGKTPLEKAEEFKILKSHRKIIELLKQ